MDCSIQETIFLLKKDMPGPHTVEIQSPNACDYVLVRVSSRDCDRISIFPAPANTRLCGLQADCGARHELKPPLVFPCQADTMEIENGAILINK